MQAVGLLDRAAFRFYCFDLFHRWCSCLDYRVSFLLSSINSFSFPFRFFFLAFSHSYRLQQLIHFHIFLLVFSFYAIGFCFFFSPLIPLSIIWKKMQIVDFFFLQFSLSIAEVRNVRSSFSLKEFKSWVSPQIAFKKLRETFEVISLKKIILKILEAIKKIAWTYFYQKLLFMYFFPV